MFIQLYMCMFTCLHTHTELCILITDSSCRPSDNTEIGKSSGYWSHNAPSSPHLTRTVAHTPREVGLLPWESVSAGQAPAVACVPCQALGAPTTAEVLGPQDTRATEPPIVDG